MLAICLTCTGPAGAFASEPVFSVVTVANTTPATIPYQLRWPGQDWQSFTVEAKKARYHWSVGESVYPEIRYQRSQGAGGQERMYRLTPRNSAGNRPSRGADGLRYLFRVADDKKTLVLVAVTPLDKSRLPEERRRLDTKERQAYPVLLSNFEVLGRTIPKNAANSYNCIAWSIGITKRWVWPGKAVADFDRLYAAHGYQRVSGLDFRVQRGVHKIVLYGHVKNNGVIECTHAARQEPNGTWTSKLGELALIRHLSPNDLNGPSYGRPVAIYVKNAS
jgi:hypothetical protein